MTFDPDMYTITIRKELVDGNLIYVGRVAEFPNLKSFEESYEEARLMIVNCLCALKKIADENGEDFPAPNKLNTSPYNGRITLRIPRTLHAKVCKLAEHEETSLNQLLVTVISEYVGSKNTYHEIVKSFRKEITSRENAFKFNDAFYSSLLRRKENITSLTVKKISKAPLLLAFMPKDSYSIRHLTLNQHTLVYAPPDNQQPESNFNFYNQKDVINA